MPACETMTDAANKPLMCQIATSAIRAGTRLARLIARLNGQQIVYRVFYRMESRVELAGRGRFTAEVNGGWLQCRILGEMFKPGRFELPFHAFWLTRRDMVLLAFDHVDNRPAERRNAAESFFTSLHCSMKVSARTPRF